MNINKKSFLFDDIDTLKGVGFKTKKIDYTKLYLNQ